MYFGAPSRLRKMDDFIKKLAEQFNLFLNSAGNKK
jgi:hypothetical protein